MVVFLKDTSPSKIVLYNTIYPRYNKNMARPNITFDEMVRFVGRNLNSEHWFKDELVRAYVTDPGDRGNRSVSLPVALYATYVAPVPVGFAPKPKCGKIGCLRPSHMVLVASRRKVVDTDMRKTALLYSKLCEFWVEPH
jgi:hypothetical protein